MIWAPFLLALGFGLLVSATLHFIFIWPDQEPHEPDERPSDSGDSDDGDSDDGDSDSDDSDSDSDDSDSDSDDSGDSDATGAP